MTDQPAGEKDMALRDARAASVGAQATGEQGVGGTLAGLLALTSDAVIVFDGAGRVLLANDEAQSLLGRANPAGSLVGLDVRALFPPAVGLAPATPFSPADLPFALDGSSARITCATADGRTVDLIVRADRVSAPQASYVLVATAASDGGAAEREHDRLVDELSRANHRLAGTLDIVLATIDSEDVRTLFSRVLEQITQTMDASGTLLYLAEGDGFHLRGASGEVTVRKSARYLGAGSGFERLARSGSGALRLRVLEPGAQDLRRGHVREREVLNEETRETYRIPTAKLPPFACGLLSPVWFGGHVIALILVGWTHTRQLRRDDARLIEAVGRYLSVQLAGALSALRQQRTQELTDLEGRLGALIVRQAGQGEKDGAGERDGAAGGQDLAPADQASLARQVLEGLGAGLACVAVPVRLDAAGEGALVAELPLGATGDGSADAGPAVAEVSLPLRLSQIEAKHAGDGRSVVVPFAPDEPLGSWLASQGQPSRGAFLDLGTLGGQQRCALLLRDADAEPLDEIELSFLHRLADDVRDITQGLEERNRDRHISQALQTGMRNELQKVPGIEAAGIYSSATQAAFVGGDFYDLIRLPDRRACVIMGDVSGKGVEAASVSAAVKTALGAYSWEGLRPARMVRLLNEFLLGFSRLETFATLFVGIVDLGSRTLTYCSAGHPPAILVRAKTGDLMTLNVQSGVVGAFREMDYRNGRVRIAPGDVLVLYTDGTTEARDPSGAFFGEEGLRDAVMHELPAGFDGLLDRLLAHLDDFTDRRLEDDVAMVALKF